LYYVSMHTTYGKTYEVHVALALMLAAYCIRHEIKCCALSGGACSAAWHSESAAGASSGACGGGGSCLSSSLLKLTLGVTSPARDPFAGEKILRVSALSLNSRSVVRNSWTSAA